ncbi:hypothetical protein [Pseudobacillus badius]|uniref:hypothetical protein n=1 Tax=Bacillus badius TaxID=1455 RepID=UPI0024A5F76A|nr:hypothetical protein [Bacillus badius]GLY09587.1 hypothetical protein Bbad01_08030 [Bacillus badius]
MASIGNITVDINTIKFARKLKAIAKHAKALADELDEIEKSFCPQCGEGMSRATDLNDGSQPVTEKAFCSSCGYQNERVLGGESE